MDLLDLFQYYEKIEEFESGDVIFEKGKPGEWMYVILKGEVEILLKGNPISHVGPGEIFGEMALIDAGARSATAVASGDCRLVSVSEDQFLAMVKKTPEFALYVMRILVSRLRKMDQKV